MDATRTPGSIRLLSFNIRQGGRSRMDAITNTILRHDPDVAIITEFRASTAKDLPERLTVRGLACQVATEVHGNENGVFIASRLPFRLVHASSRACPNQRRWLEAEFKHFRIGALYNAVHQADSQVFHTWLCDLMVARRSQSFILMGDLNWLEMGDGGNENPGAVEWLRALGFTDAWRKLNPTARDYSWTNHNGTRTRVDYAFLSKRVDGRLARAWYAHDERECEVSDHCPLLVDLAGLDRISRVVGAVRGFGKPGPDEQKRKGRIWEPMLN